MKYLIVGLILITGCTKIDNIPVTQSQVSEPLFIQPKFSNNTVNINSSVYGNAVLTKDGNGWIGTIGTYGVDLDRKEWKLVQMSVGWWRVDLVDLSDNRRLIAAWRAENLSVGQPTIFTCENPTIQSITVTLN